MSAIWELDFYSRPILDEQQKKQWEVVVCESPLEVTQDVSTLFRYSKFCPNNQVNSLWLEEALQDAISKAGRSPKRIRFFRRQMNNMITKACESLGIMAQPSRRVVTLGQWLNQRFQDYYPTLEGFQATQADPLASAVSYDLGIPKPLPDVVVGQKWAFVTLEAAAFADMADWSIDFQEAFPLSMVGLTPEANIPGLIIFSSRATPLAGWMAGLEPAFLKFESQPNPRLILETGASDRWILATLATSALQTEGQGFEAAKQKAQQVHFLAVQSHPDSEAFAGFWLLQDTNLA